MNILYHLIFVVVLAFILNVNCGNVKFQEKKNVEIKCDRNIHNMRIGFKNEVYSFVVHELDNHSKEIEISKRSGDYRSTTLLTTKIACIGVGDFQVAGSYVNNDKLVLLLKDATNRILYYSESADGDTWTALQRIEGEFNRITMEYSGHPLQIMDGDDQYYMVYCELGDFTERLITVCYPITDDYKVKATVSVFLNTMISEQFNFIHGASFDLNGELHFIINLGATVNFDNMTKVNKFKANKGVTSYTNTTFSLSNVTDIVTMKNNYVALINNDMKKLAITEKDTILFKYPRITSKIECASFTVVNEMKTIVLINDKRENALIEIVAFPDTNGGCVHAVNPDMNGELSETFRQIDVNAPTSPYTKYICSLKEQELSKNGIGNLVVSLIVPAKTAFKLCYAHSVNDIDDGRLFLDTVKSKRYDVLFSKPSLNQDDKAFELLDLYVPLEATANTNKYSNIKCTLEDTLFTVDIQLLKKDINIELDDTKENNYILSPGEIVNLASCDKSDFKNAKFPKGSYLLSEDDANMKVEISEYIPLGYTEVLHSDCIDENLAQNLSYLSGGESKNYSGLDLAGCSPHYQPMIMNITKDEIIRIDVFNFETEKTIGLTCPEKDNDSMTCFESVLIDNEFLADNEKYGVSPVTIIPKRTILFNNVRGYEHLITIQEDAVKAMTSEHKIMNLHCACKVNGFNVTMNYVIIPHGVEAIPDPSNGDNDKPAVPDNNLRKVKTCEEKVEVLEHKIESSSSGEKLDTLKQGTEAFSCELLLAKLKEGLKQIECEKNIKLAEAKLKEMHCDECYTTFMKKIEKLSCIKRMDKIKYEILKIKKDDIAQKIQQELENIKSIQKTENKTNSKGYTCNAFLNIFILYIFSAVCIFFI